MPEASTNGVCSGADKGATAVFLNTAVAATVASVAPVNTAEAPAATTVAPSLKEIEIKCLKWYEKYFCVCVGGGTVAPVKTAEAPSATNRCCQIINKCIF
jgi:hypothetical protein